VTEVLAHRSRALTPEETEELLRDRLGDHVQRAVVEYGLFTLWIAPEGWLAAARHCRDERLLAYDMFDSLLGVDAREEGFDVVAILYSTSTGNRLALRTRCPGGRDAPVLDSITEIYRGADWMERETYDMFGVEFAGHPSLTPRILTVDNFEGWPLRKDFHLAARVAKPWPGVAEPVELDEDGNKIERERSIGDAPGPYELDKAMAAQAQQVNAPPAPEVEEPEAAAVTEAAEAAGDDGAAAAADDTPADAAGTAGDRRKQQAEARAAKARERAEKAKARAAAKAAAEGGEAAPPAESAAAATQPAADAPEPASAPEPAPEATAEPAAEAPAPEEAEEAEEAEGDVDPRVAARRKRQAEARAKRAAARAGKTDGGDGAAAAEEATAEPAEPAAAAAEAAPAPEATAEPAEEAPAPEPAAEAPAPEEAEEAEGDVDPRVAARRKRQAEARARRAKARQERADAEGDEEGDA